MISLPEADIKENGRLLRMLSLYLRASNSNKPEVPLQIAEMYATGRDAPSDPVAAWAWLQIAAGRGAAAAQARITEATSHLSAEQLEKAQRLHTELGEELRKVSAAIGLARKA
jgi:TPR repeat protein